MTLVEKQPTVVREKLLEDSELTLKKAVETCRAHEASQNKLLAMSKEVAIDIDRLSQGQGQSRSSYRPAIILLSEISILE